MDNFISIDSSMILEPSFATMENIFTVSIVLFFSVIISGFVITTHHSMQKDGTEQYKRNSKEFVSSEQTVASFGESGTKNNERPIDNVEIDNRRKIKFGLLQMPSPEPTIGGCATIQNDAGFLFLTGGYGAPEINSDVDILSTSEMTWEREPGNISPLSFCSSILMDCRLFIFGGIDAESKLNDQLLEYDFDKRNWEPVSCLNYNGQVPDGRFNGTFTLLDENSAILFGGRGNDGSCLNDIWKLELHGDASLSWTKVMKSSTISDHDNWILQCRESHFSVCIDHKIFIIGGCGHSGAADIISPEEVGIIECSDDGKVFNLSEVETFGDYPKNLIGGSAHALGDTGKIIVISGEDSCHFNAIYTLDTRTVPMKWDSLALDFRGDIASVPGLRLFSASCLDSVSGLIYIFGGHSGDGEPQEGVCVIECVDLMDTPNTPASSAASSPVASSERQRPFGDIGVDEDNKVSIPDDGATYRIDSPKSNISAEDSFNNDSSELDEAGEGEGKESSGDDFEDDVDPTMPELIVKCYDSFRGTYLYRTANVGSGYSSFGLIDACCEGDAQAAAVTGRFGHAGPLDLPSGTHPAGADGESDTQQSEGELNAEMDEELGPLPPLIYKCRPTSA